LAHQVASRKNPSAPYVPSLPPSFPSSHLSGPRQCPWRKPPRQSFLPAYGAGRWRPDGTRPPPPSISGREEGREGGGKGGAKFERGRVLRTP
jgi:hypothetical protein